MLFKVGKNTEGELIAYTDEEKQKAMLEAIADRIDEVIGRWPESYACARIDEIHKGFEWSEFYRSDTDRTYHLTPEQSRVMDERSKNCWESFCQEKEIDHETDYNDLKPDQQNDFSDYENEWFEPALLRLSLQDGELYLSINYTDQPYYRYQYDEAILKIDALETVDENIEAMKAEYDAFLKAENHD